jgi:hypothetical protein
MPRMTWMTTRRAGLLAVMLMGLVASSVQAQMCGGGPMGSQAGSPAQPPGQPSMMGQGMMGQGMCPMWMMPTAAAMRGGPMDPMGLLGLLGDSPMDPQTRGQMLELQGELLKAMSDVLIKHGQALRGKP